MFNLQQVNFALYPFVIMVFVFYYLFQLSRIERPLSFKLILWFGKRLLAVSVSLFLFTVLYNWPKWIGITASGILPVPPWYLAYLIVILAVLKSYQSTLSAIWKATIVGVFGGMLITSFLAYPVMAITYNNFVPGLEFSGVSHNWAFWIGTVISSLLLLALGPITVFWCKPSSIGKRIFLGILATGISGWIVFASLGAPAAGVAGSQSLYGVAYSREGYDSVGWLIALVEAVTYTYPYTYGCFFGILGISTIIGALSAWFTSPFELNVDDRSWLSTEAQAISFPIVLIVLSIWAVIEIATIILLGPIIENTARNVSANLWWQPNWIVLLVSGMPVVAYCLWIAYSGYWLKKKANPSRLIGYVSSLTGILVIVTSFLLYFIVSNIVFLLIAIFSTGIGVDLFRHGIQVSSQKKSDHDLAFNGVDWRTWSRVGLLAGLIIMVFDLPFVSAALNLVLIPIVAMAELMLEYAPPPGQAWLQDMLGTAINGNSLLLPQIGLIGAFIGALIGIASSELSQWFLVDRWRNKALNLYEWLSNKLSRRPKYVLIFVYVFLFGLISYFFGPIIVALIAYYYLWKKPKLFKQISPAFILLAFGICFGSLILYDETVLANRIFRAPFVMIIGFSWAIVYFAFVAYQPPRLARWAHIIFVILIGLFSVVIQLTSQSIITTVNGTSQFINRRWVPMKAETIPLNDDLAYSMVQSKNGDIWFVDFSGIGARFSENQWFAYPHIGQLSQDTLEWVNEAGRTAKVLEDSRGNLWTSGASGLVRFTFNPNANDYLSVIPSYKGSFPESDSCTNQTLDSPEDQPRVIGPPAIESTGIAITSQGVIWASSSNSGVLVLLDTEVMDQAKWLCYDRDNSPIVSNNITALLVDKHDRVWIGSNDGISIFENDTWDTVLLDEIGLRRGVQVIYEDRHGNIWIGSGDGVTFWDGQDWENPELFSVSGNELSVTNFFEDSQGSLWALTSEGAHLFDNQGWHTPIDIPVDPLKNVPYQEVLFTRQPDETGVNVMVEEPDGKLWLGGPQGLLLLDNRTGEQELFYTSNSGLPSPNVHSLLIDDQERLWVSTYTVDIANWSQVPVLGAGIPIFGLMIFLVIQGYRQTPKYRALQLVRKVQNEPDLTLVSFYQSLKDHDDAADVLNAVGEIEEKSLASDQIDLARTLAAVSESERLAEASGIDTLAKLINTQTGQNYAKEMGVLYSYLAEAASANSISAIGEWSLRIMQEDPTSPATLISDETSPVALPPLIDKATINTIQVLGKTATLLKKYLQVDNQQDKLNYLSESLSQIERAAHELQAASLPERNILQYISGTWKERIDREIIDFSGQALLRLELRTRQVRMAKRITLAFLLKNVGRAVAENIVVKLEDNIDLQTEGESQVQLAKLSSGENAQIEFTIVPGNVDTARLLCTLQWDDRVTQNNRDEYADVIRLYETPEHFQRIPNPYIVGHPIKSIDIFQGREDVFRFIGENISGPIHDRTIVLYGQRRTGKTSILYQILNGRLGKEFIPVLVDMQELAVSMTSPGDLLYEVAYKIGREVQKAGIALETIKPEEFSTTPTRAFNRFLDALENALAGKPVLLMFDEFELIQAKIDEGKLNADLLGYFRSLMQHRESLVFIFTGTHRLEEMSQDYWSIFFNIALHQRISFLEFREAEKLVRHPVADFLSMDDLAVEKIIRLTNGHPYFIQLLCWAIVNHCNTNQRNYVTINDINDVVQATLTTGEAYFAYIWQRATLNEKEVLAALAGTVKPGYTWIRPVEVLEKLVAAGETDLSQEDVIASLDSLLKQEILEVASEGALRYRFQIELLQLWLASTKSIAAIVERKR